MTLRRRRLPRARCNQTKPHHAAVAALTSGYDRAFGISAGVLVAGALVAILLPAQLGAAQPPAPIVERSERATAAAKA